MKINFNVELKDLKGNGIVGGPVMAADQLASLVLSDRGESVDGARQAFQLNGLMEQIARAKEPVELSEEEITLLKTVLDTAVKSHNVSTFLVGRLWGILEGSESGNKATGAD